MKVKFKNGSEIKAMPTPEEMAIRSIRAREQIEKMTKSTNELQLAFENLSDPVKMTSQILNDMADMKDGIYSKLTWYQKGVITAITDEYVFGVVLFNAVPELNTDRTTTVGFEVISPLNKEVNR